MSLSEQISGWLCHAYVLIFLLALSNACYSLRTGPMVNKGLTRSSWLIHIFSLLVPPKTRTLTRRHVPSLVDTRFKPSDSTKVLKWRKPNGQQPRRRHASWQNGGSLRILTFRILLYLVMWTGPIFITIPQPSLYKLSLSSISFFNPQCLACG